MTNILAKSENKKCKNCGGNLVFSPSFQCLKCENCGSTQSVNKDDNIALHPYSAGLSTSSSQKAMIFNCQNCGASVSGSNQISKSCSYCGSPYVANFDSISGIKPDYVIPFKFDKERAGQMFVNGVKRKMFLPNKFKKKPSADKIDAFYIPVFNFNEKTSSVYKGVLSQTHTTGSGENVRTYTTTQNISGTKEMSHKDVVVESSSLINQLDLDGILPYNMSEKVKFDQDFIRGYSLEYYTDSLETCKKLADTIIDQKIRTSILSKYSYDTVNYLNISTTRTEEKYSHGVLPVYKFSYKYKNKDYVTLVNGQTGKVGSGLPKSGVKIAMLVISILLVIAGFVALFLYLD